MNETVLLYKAKNDQYKEIMTKALDTDYIKELIRYGGLSGEPHSDYSEGNNGVVRYDKFLTIDPMKISHIIKSFWWEDLHLYGDVEYYTDNPLNPYFFKQNGYIITYLPRMIGICDRNKELKAIHRFVTFDFTADKPIKNESF